MKWTDTTSYRRGQERVPTCAPSKNGNWSGKVLSLSEPEVG